MRQTRPLPDTHPEFTVTHQKGFTEYRVEHWRLAHDGSGRVVRGAHICSWVDIGALSAVALWVRSELPLSFPLLVGIGVALTYLVWTRFTQVLYESLLVFPTLGVQLETHRGHPLLPTLSSTHRFIPLSSLEDVIIHEGFRRWTVRYYLAALRRTRTSPAITDGDGHGKGDTRVCVAFENILPYFPVLQHVYLGVQDALFPTLTRVVVDTKAGRTDDS